MIQKIFNSSTKPSIEEKSEIVDFLYTHLEEFGDSKADIEKAIDFSLNNSPMANGGFVLVTKDNSDIVGVVVINRTGMEGYIPENILVYIATHKERRGKGIGKKLIEKTKELVNGDIALHVEPDNPAKYLYEKVGFENKYLEMRLKQNK